MHKQELLEKQTRVHLPAVGCTRTVVLSGFVAQATIGRRALQRRAVFQAARCANGITLLPVFR